MLDFRFKNKTKKSPSGPYILYASEADASTCTCTKKILTTPPPGAHLPLSPLLLKELNGALTKIECRRTPGGTPSTEDRGSS